MKIVIVGGTGLIGSKLAYKLSNHELVIASPSKGVNAYTGEGLKEALKGAEIIVDVSNSPSFDNEAALVFFEKATSNLLQETKDVKHYIALSVVGTDRLKKGYFNAKGAQEKLITSSKVPYTIVRATQFFEFLDAIAQTSIQNGEVHLPPVSFQPIAAEDVATLLIDVILDKPKNGVVEIAGPEKFVFPDIVRQYLDLKNDTHKVVSDNDATYFGVKVEKGSLVPSGSPRLGKTNFQSWINSSRT